MPNGMEDMWIAGSKIYTDQEEFNKDSQRIMPSAYKFNLMAVLLYHVDPVLEVVPCDTVSNKFK